jgi:hypothetical protein
MLTFDRDPRWIGSRSGRDFPSPLVRFLTCLGIVANICPPSGQTRMPTWKGTTAPPSKNVCSCIIPARWRRVCDVTEAFVHHDNEERPHQGRSCGNQPPRVAYPIRPPLPKLSTTVQPNRWLQHFHQQAFMRLVGSDGCVELDLHTYSISQSLAGQPVAFLVDAYERCLNGWRATTLFTRLPMKGRLRRRRCPLSTICRPCNGKPARRLSGTNGSVARSPNARCGREPWETERKKGSHQQAR